MNKEWNMTTPAQLTVPNFSFSFSLFTRITSVYVYGSCSVRKIYSQILSLQATNLNAAAELNQNWINPHALLLLVF